MWGSQVISLCKFNRSILWILFAIVEGHVIKGAAAYPTPPDAQYQDLLMRDAKPRTHDQYLCTAYPVDDEEAYIYKFEALANADTAHHMLLYGCQGEPYSQKPIWNCPFMCEGGSPTIMFAWAKNAPPTVLPKDVGLRIGQNTNLRTIVLQVHYAKKFEEDESPDRSGIRIHTTYEKQPFVAGIFLMMSTWFQIPPNNSSYPVDISCEFQRDMTMVPFAYRTHAHGLGKVITGYQYNGTYTEIGKGNPQWPQAFYPVKGERIEIKQGDFLAARCTYDSSSMTHTVKVGATGDDEMCNFYIMFYTDGSVDDPYGQCMNNQLPKLTGTHFPNDVSVPLPSNPALEEKAHGHHHHGGMAGSQSPGDEGDDDSEKNQDNQEVPTGGGDEVPAGEGSDGPTGDGDAVSTKIPTTVQLPAEGTRKQEEKIPSKTKLVLHQILTNGPDQKHLPNNFTDNSRKAFYNYRGKGEEQELVPPSYDFVDIDPRAIPYEKRENHEYYEDYAANDLREKGLYGVASGDRGLSRNRHKEFEAMNQQLQQFPGQKPGTSGQPQSAQYRPFSQQRGGQARPHKVAPETASGHNSPQQAGSQAQEGASQAAQQPKSQNHIHFQHSLVYNETWPVNPIRIGQVGGIATDKEGRVYIFHRGSRVWNARSFSFNNDFMFQDAPINEDVLLILDKQGQLVHKFGAGQYFMPHGIEIDHEGNAWITDVALHQVFKIPLAAYVAKEKPSESPKSTLVLGKRFQHGQDNDLFCKPTDVAVLQNGDFFVSDGYCNTRVLKFSKEGKFIKSWGQPAPLYKVPPPPGTFNLPHGIAVAEDQKLVFVADRENGRVQCFDLDGNFKQIIKHQEFGPRIFGVDYSPDHGGVLYAVNGPGYDGQHPFNIQGFTLDIKTGALLEMWNTPQQLKSPHDVCVDSASQSQSVYVGELDPSMVWKLSRMEAPPPRSHHLDDHDDLDEPSTPEKKVGDKSKPKPDEKKDEPKVTTTPGKDLSTDEGVSLADKKEKEGSPDSMTPSLIIGLLLVVPVILLLIITLVIRAHKSGHFQSKGKKVFNLQGFLGNSHKGFDPLSTEESDHDLDPEDSDRDEYLAPRKIKSKP